MGMIPTCPVEISDKCVSEASSWRNWTLLNSRYTIHPPERAVNIILDSISVRNHLLGRFLQNAVPVECSTLWRAVDLIVNCNLNGVSP
jgi:hypothetical protein